MTCSSCEAKVKSALLTLPDVNNAEVTRTAATITVEKHIALSELQKAIGAKGNYTISAEHHNETAEQAKRWFETYKPILLIFFYITTITSLIQFSNQQFDFMIWILDLDTSIRFLVQKNLNQNPNHKYFYLVN
jgi:copper chaperone CopZ